MTISGLPLSMFAVLAAALLLAGIVARPFTDGAASMVTVQ
jgi:hypothetical protein